MHRAFAFLIMVGSAGVLLGGCGEPTGPEPEAALKAAASDVPSQLSATPVSPTEIQMSWADTRNEDGFEIHRSAPATSATYSLAGQTGANVTVYNDTKLMPGTDYCYKVRSYRNTGKNNRSLSTFSNPACRRTPKPPAAPSSVNAVPAFSNVVDVTWALTTSPVTAISVEWSATGAPDGQWTMVDPPVSGSPYRHFGRQSETQVCYRVYAYNDEGRSPASAVDCTTPPLPPTELKATSADGHSIDLAWKYVTGSEDGFEIQRSDGNGTWTVIATPPADAASHRDQGLAAGTKYNYRMRTRKDGGFSSFSMEVSALPVETLPDAAENVNVYGWSSTGVSVTWTPAAANVEEYRVERSVNNWATREIVGTFPSFYGRISDEGRQPDERVCYRVIAHNRLGDSPEPHSADCVTPPIAVKDFKATPGGNGTINLTWTNPSSVTTGYSIEILTLVWVDGGNCYSYCYGHYDEQWVPIEPPPLASDTRYEVTGLSPYEEHQFRIITLAEDAIATPSAVAASWTEPPPPAPPSLTTYSDAQVSAGVIYARRVLAMKNGISEPSTRVPIALSPEQDE